MPDKIPSVSPMLVKNAKLKMMRTRNEKKHIEIKTSLERSSEIKSFQTMGQTFLREVISASCA